MTEQTILDQTEALVRAAWTTLSMTEEYKAMQSTPQYQAWQALNAALSTIKKQGGKPVADVFAPPPARARFPRLTQVGAAKRVLRLAGRPMTTAELLSKMADIGYPVGGENPELNLSSTLSRSDNVTSVKENGVSKWWIVDK